MLLHLCPVGCSVQHFLSTLFPSFIPILSNFPFMHPLSSSSKSQLHLLFFVYSPIFSSFSRHNPFPWKFSLKFNYWVGVSFTVSKNLFTGIILSPKDF